MTNDSRVFIIAEAGVNHNGNLDIAKRLIDVAAAAGADAVKFQTFRAHDCVCRHAPKAEYQKFHSPKGLSHQAMLRSLELDESAHRVLCEHCRARKIMFLSSPFDLRSIALLDTLGLTIFKIPSGEITNAPYLRKIGSLHKRVILSTGMADMKEIGTALKILSRAGTPKSRITVLHCHTEYPTSFADANILAMLAIKNKFHISVGYSDHTHGIEASIAAVALGADVIEKHFTLDKKMPGPDQEASLDPDELHTMVQSVRNVEQALGSGIKKPSRAETKNITVVRKSIVAEKVISKGEVFTVENITAKRPGTGISPMLWDKVIGRRAKKAFQPDEFISI